MHDLVKRILRRVLPKKWYLQCAFRAKFGKWINFAHPESLNEKLQYSKVYGYKDIHRVIADKYAVRQYIKDVVGEKYLIPLVGVFRNHDDVDFSALPSSFVAKSAHGSGQVLIVRDKLEISEDHLRKAFKKWLETNFYFVSMEPQYKHIEPKIVVEELMADEQGRIPNDYKFHCFAGKVEMIQVDLDRFGEHRRNFYNSDWELLPFIWSAVDKNKKSIYVNGKTVHKPAQLNEMVKVAEQLSKRFNYIRVDMYDVSGRVYFGELTLHHGGGFEHFTPSQYDIYYGRLMTLERHCSV